MAKYLKPGEAETFVEDNAEIEYLKFNNLRHSVSGFMLGDFDEHGVYAVSPKIVKELISMKKYIVDTLEDMEICDSEIVLLGPITFLVSYEQDYATLSLIEKVNYESNAKDDTGAYSNINEYILDTVQTSGRIDKNAIYRRWNISLFAGEHRKLEDLTEEEYADIMGLAERFKYLLYVNTMFAKKEEELEAIETTYTEDIMNLIARYPKLKKVVDEAIKGNLATKKDFIKLDKPQLSKTINELIEQVVEENIDVLTEKEKKEFATDKHIIQNNYNIAMQDAIPQKIEKPVIRGVEKPVGRVVVETDHKENQSIKTLIEQLSEEKQKNIERAEHEAVEHLANDNKIEPPKPVVVKTKKGTTVVVPPERKGPKLARIAAALGAVVANEMRKNNVDPKTTAEAEKAKKAKKKGDNLVAAAAQSPATAAKPAAKKAETSDSVKPVDWKPTNPKVTASKKPAAAKPTAEKTKDKTADANKADNGIKGATSLKPKKPATNIEEQPKPEEKKPADKPRTQKRQQKKEPEETNVSSVEETWVSVQTVNRSLYNGSSLLAAKSSQIKVRNVSGEPQSTINPATGAKKRVRPVSSNRTNVANPENERDEQLTRGV